MLAGAGGGSVTPLMTQQLTLRYIMTTVQLRRLVGTGESLSGIEAQLEGFFQFGRFPRIFRDAQPLQDVQAWAVTFDYFVKDWPTSPPPHPAFFEELFPLLIRNLMRDQILTMHVKSVDSEVFSEETAIRELLIPGGHKYAMLNDISSGFPTEKTFGNLFFETPQNLLEHVTREWFVSPQVTIQGFVAPVFPIDGISKWYYGHDNAESMRSLMRSISCGFSVWRDFNGLVVLTDKWTESDLRSRVITDELQDAIDAAVERYQRR
jgi:hypothetical protein